jgi:hypothetical protein
MMSHIRRQLALVFIVAMTITSGAVAGALNNRWGAPASLSAAAGRFANFPDQFGPWQLEKSEPFIPAVAEILECAASTSRVYRHRETGDAIQVAMHVGPPGPTSVHTPDVCLSSQDFEQVTAPERIQILSGSQGGGSFWKTNFRARTLDGSAAHLIYGWSTGQGWMAAQRPRLEFVGHRLLYKIQVASRFNGHDDDDRQSVYREFLEELLPRLASEVLTSSAM